MLVALNSMLFTLGQRCGLHNANVASASCHLVLLIHFVFDIRSERELFITIIRAYIAADELKRKHFDSVGWKKKVTADLVTFIHVILSTCLHVDYNTFLTLARHVDFNTFVTMISYMLVYYYTFTSVTLAHCPGSQLIITIYVYLVSCLSITFTHYAGLLLALIFRSTHYVHSTELSTLICKIYRY